MNRIIFAGMLLLLIYNSGHSQTFTLKQCIEYALSHNLPVQQSELQKDAAQISYQQAKTDVLPNLNGGIGYGFNRGRNVDPITNNYINSRLSSSDVSLSSSIILFNGLRMRNIIKQTRYTYEASKMDWQQVKDNLTLNIILAYLQVLSSEDALQIARSQLTVTQQQVQRTQVLVNEGAVGNYQLTDLRGQQANEELSIASFENSIQQAKLNLSQLMNIAYDPAMALIRTNEDTLVINYSSTSNDVTENAFDKMAMVKASIMRIKSAASLVKAISGNYFPRLSLNANLGSRYSSLARSLSATGQTIVATGDYVLINSTQNAVLRKQENYQSEKIGYGTQLNNNLGTFAGLSLSVPLFNNFRTRNQVKVAKIEQHNAILEADRIKAELKKNIDQEWLNMNLSFNRYKILLQQEKDFAESFRAAEIRFTSGVINSYEFLMAKNNLDKARSNLSQARYEYLFRTKLLDYYAGKQSW